MFVPLQQHAPAQSLQAPSQQITVTMRAESWYTLFNTAAVNPIFMINRIGYPTSHLKQKSQLDATIRNQLLTLATARIRIQQYI